MASLTYDEYLRLVAWYQTANPAQRAGQAHANILAIIRPDLAHEIHGSTFGPFCNDNRLAASLECVAQRFTPHPAGPAELICDRCDRPTMHDPDTGGCRCITDPAAVHASRRLVEQRHHKAVERATPNGATWIEAA